MGAEFKIGDRVVNAHYKSGSIFKVYKSASGKFSYTVGLDSLWRHATILMRESDIIAEPDPPQYYTVLASIAGGYLPMNQESAHAYDSFESAIEGAKFELDFQREVYPDDYHPVGSFEKNHGVTICDGLGYAQLTIEIVPIDPGDLDNFEID